MACFPRATAHAIQNGSEAAYRQVMPDLAAAAECVSALMASRWSCAIAWAIRCAREGPTESGPSRIPYTTEVRNGRYPRVR